MGWLDGDLKAFTAGLAVGGGWNHTLVHDAFSPRIWNDEGRYDRFYIDFLRPIRDFSFGQFTSSVHVMASRKLLTVSAAVRVSQSVICLFANIEGQTHGVTVIGADQSKLSYEGGGAVPRFVQTFQVAGLLTFSDYAWVFEQCTAPEAAARTAERLGCLYTPVTRYEGISEAAAAPEPCGQVREAVEISYFEV